MKRRRERAIRHCVCGCHKDLSNGYPLPGEMSAADEQSQISAAVPRPSSRRSRTATAMARGYGANINHSGWAVSLFNNTKKSKE